MLKKLIHISNNDSGTVAFDWVVLTAGVISLGMAVTLTATHNANAASEQSNAAIMVASTAH